MDLRQLRYFIAIVEHGGFTRAAEALAVAQPALSAQIRHLEDELETQLLVRHSRGVTPTADGSLLFERARVILAEVRDTHAALLAGRAAPRGHLSLGITPSNNVATTARLVRRCLDALSEVELTVVEGVSGDVLEWIGAGRVDLGVVYCGDEEPADIVLEPLGTEPLVSIEPAIDGAAPPATVTLAEVCAQPLILSAAPHFVRRLIEDAAARQGLTAHVPFEMQSVATVFEMIAQGVGCSVLPAGAATRIGGDRRLTARRIVEPSFTLRLALAHAASRPLSPAAIAARALITESFATPT